MSYNPLILFSYAAIAGLWVGSQVIDIPYVMHLMLLVTSILYAACHWSLTLREEQALARGESPPKEGKDDDTDNTEGDDDDEEEEEERPQYETLTSKDAMQFPLLGSASLFGLYCAFKFFDKETVNLIISVYFCLVGVAALTATLGPTLESVGPKFLSNEIKLKHFLPESIGGKSPWIFNVSEVFGLMGGIAFNVAYFQSKHWTMNNVLGICFCLQGIERFSLGTYKIGAILLVGLFFYDIFWVFGTDVMVTVAKSLDGPIKILFPRSLVPHATTGKLEMSLLGLGDIVIPGFFLALLLRFDAHNAKVDYFPTNVHVSFPKPYFHSALVGYVLGLATTLYVMIVFEAAQPALLYLVPACLGSSLLCAAVRGEMKALFDYSEEEEEEKEEESKDEADKKND
eukprot:CAMPEP_0201740638 /NCGR_PEP_ID=MMETSP0593-20130828/46407_1 /ASSEMBLY_ACC=CAM_ASM_000672 /TAXON_ID=267983 /ORGANISM="Skeletonema japonicum, Strain CCMP2506" /LENGTH=399 /DNA_ID=CAMNT_0048234959 /DNA_START=37 /DNA_END=1236 /DNA_ORIENTATION=+